MSELESLGFFRKLQNAVYEAMGIFYTEPPAPLAQAIELNYMSSLTSAQMSAFEQAKEKWNSVITEEPEEVFIDGVLSTKIKIDVTVEPIDGSGGTLGQAGPTSLRPVSGLPATGIMEFDSADLSGLENAGLLDEVVLHEMGHVLGFVYFLWESYGLATGGGTSDPRFLGANAVAEYSALTGKTETFVPLEHSTGPGSDDSHIEESTFDDEIMTPILNFGSNPISRLTIAIAEDMGYSVDYSQAESYNLPNSLLASVRSEHAYCCNVTSPEIE